MSDRQYSKSILIYWDAHQHAHAHAHTNTHSLFTEGQQRVMCACMCEVDVTNLHFLLSAVSQLSNSFHSQLILRHLILQAQWGAGEWNSIWPWTAHVCFHSEFEVSVWKTVQSIALLADAQLHAPGPTN
eukprot:1139895-Pelagomonas_calceolata.AAC.3